MTYKDPPMDIDQTNSPNPPRGPDVPSSNLSVLNERPSFPDQEPPTQASIQLAKGSKPA